MKKAWFFAAVVLGWAMLSSISFGYSGGEGTANNPYQIACVNDLLELAGDTDNYDKCFIMMADVDLAGRTFTTALIAPDTDLTTGHFQGAPFVGTFDGAGHRIINMTYITPLGDAFIGLFGYVYYATIENLNLENVNIHTEGLYTGGLVGLQEGGFVKHCSVDGRITCDASETSSFAGGLIGCLYSGTVVYCTNTGSVGSFGYDSLAGGIVGEMVHGNIAYCSNSGSVTAYYASGGLAAYQCGGFITDCYSKGPVESVCYDYVFSSFNDARSVNYAGGIVGIQDLDSSFIVNCCSMAMVSCFSYARTTDSYSADAYSYAYTGGLAGRAGGTISRSCNMGTTTSHCFSLSSGSSYSFSGGLIGLQIENSSISNCYNTGSISSLSFSVSDFSYAYAGGLVGKQANYGIVKVENCYSTGPIYVNAKTVYQGGLLGYKYSSVTSCFWDTDVSGIERGVGNVNPDPDGVKGKTTAGMKALSTFSNAGWNFTDTWAICDGNNYPLLKWQKPLGDFACPDGVNVEDVDYFVGRWLMENCTSLNNYCGGADVDGSGWVDLGDWAEFAQHWLEGI